MICRFLALVLSAVSFLGLGRAVLCTLHVLLTMHVLNQDSNIFCYIVILHAMLRLKLQRKMILLQFAAVKF